MTDYSIKWFLCLPMIKAILITLLTSVAASSTTTPPPCPVAPAHALPADTSYELNVAGEPELFIAGELYTVSLRGIDNGQGPTPFVGFSIWVEIEGASDTSTGSNNLTHGVFQTYDAQAKAHEFCEQAVDNSTSHPKTEIQVIWNAPKRETDTCVRICARASASETSSTWSVLVRKLCAAPDKPSSFTKQPPIVEPCCACDEAKYEMTFEGLWSRNMHPRDFPPEVARAHFGDIIGASHTGQYRVWQEGRIASTGLKRLAEDGMTTALEKELKAESDHIRTIIKARGITWQQVASGVGAPSTFAVFRVDAKNHLVSLASKLAPSPDWIVGVSALELCNSNCTWTMSATLPLYPYDAGTDNGITYTARRQPTKPAAPVRALRPDWPRDVRSPFFSTSSEMRPFARLRINRLRLYEKSCEATDMGKDNIQEAGVSGSGVCATHEWGPWGLCSVSCGEGRQARQRYYVWPARAYAEACRAPLTDYRRCYGPRRHCRAPSEYEPDPAEAAGPCAVSSWSPWSPCEGCGIRARTRHYIASHAHKRCHIGFRARTIMSQALPCDAGPCNRPNGEDNSTNFDWFFVDMPRGECPTTTWGDWSPCSANCGRGRQMRTRLFLVKDSRAQPYLTKRLLRTWNQRFAELQKLDLQPENVTAKDPEVEALVQEQLTRCQSTLSAQEALCDGDDYTCFNASHSHEICKQSVDVGHCRGYDERWFYDWSRGACEPFGYTGCGGNSNNFRTKVDCQRICQHVDNATDVVLVHATKAAKPTKPTKTSILNEIMQNDSPAQEETVVNCEVGPWIGWSQCFGDCDYAVKLNYRLFTRRPSNSGKACPKVIKSRQCRPGHCRKTNDSIEATPTHSSYDDDY